ncbi:methyltransferase domain-containing protein [Kitasatospora sp. NBC_01287]|uniref:class I SAM-dependent methyltransferase n=1 Tax=Kitasatospora sp. NBC_01287 TaxID=2903573 RepID=UPI00225A22BA|nr:class I SAM-dependent methyltransferase [Kitasatospora sp. NBC_01287]MCX4745717.1 methyltransferase domain-containing protein [Kitasatospora sp. NBC_01287]
MGDQASRVAERALSYGSVAEVYDQARPGYPPELFAHLAERVPGRRVLEVGAGTGKATLGLLAQGFSVTCVEPVAEMAAVLARRTEGEPGARIHLGTFESFAAPAGPGAFDALLSAQAWHWTDPATRLDRAAALLRPGGFLGLFWNSGALREQRAFAALEALYDDFGLVGDDRPGEPIGSTEAVAAVQDPNTWPADEIAAHPAFDYLGTSLFPWHQEFTAAGFADFLSSTSPYQVLEPAFRERLLAEVTAMVRERFADRITLDWSTQSYDARRAA